METSVTSIMGISCKRVTVCHDDRRISACDHHTIKRENPTAWGFEYSPEPVYDPSREAVSKVKSSAGTGAY
ncbi:hypothetical protein ACRZCT_004820, partial [Aeromonas hydrophila]